MTALIGSINHVTFYCQFLAKMLIYGAKKNHKYREQCYYTENEKNQDLEETSNT